MAFDGTPSSPLHLIMPRLGTGRGEWWSARRNVTQVAGRLITWDGMRLGVPNQLATVGPGPLYNGATITFDGVANWLAGALNFFNGAAAGTGFFSMSSTYNSGVGQIPVYFNYAANGSITNPRVLFYGDTVFGLELALLDAGANFNQWQSAFPVNPAAVTRAVYAFKWNMALGAACTVTVQRDGVVLGARTLAGVTAGTLAGTLVDIGSQGGGAGTFAPMVLDGLVLVPAALAQSDMNAIVKGLHMDASY